MILYNVTVSLDPEIQEDWLDWMRSTHIPDVMNTGCFLESRISRVHGEESEVTYAVSYVAESEEIYDHYQATHAVGLQKDHLERYEGKFAAFRTKLTILEEFKK
ncbi:MAG: DUF4286 family protein [Crocinitomicaceae bacterium]|nr:DUF4286 family protein [Flavobacteriales bacterium]NQZ36334.1 DUF4286 family protein [Crocinitomicaceae bacterium]